MWPSPGSGFCLLLGCTFAGFGPQLSTAADDWESDEPIPDKVGAEVHLTRKERSQLKKMECSMCRAILREMHVEVSKHKMIAKGFGSESQVWETTNAICLALLQKYKLDLKAGTLERKPDDEDDDAGMGGVPQDFRAMLVLKMGCQQWVEDYGGDTSGYIYKVVKKASLTAETAAEDFCTAHVNLCGEQKKRKQKKDREQEAKRVEKRQEFSRKEAESEAKHKEKDPFEALPEDSKFGLQRMLEMARDDPLHYMEEDAKQRVQQARAELRCDVCRAVVEAVHGEVEGKPKSKRQEHDILRVAEGACEGGKDRSVPSYFGVDPPALPPAWADRYRPHLAKKSKRYKLRSYPKKERPARLEWRELAAGGKQKPPEMKVSEGDMMMTLTCKDLLEPERMAEALYKQMSLCSDGAATAATDGRCDPALLAASDVCQSAERAPCDYGGGAAAEEKLEL